MRVEKTRESDGILSAALAAATATSAVNVPAAASMLDQLKSIFVNIYHKVHYKLNTTANLANQEQTVLGGSLLVSFW